MKFSKKRLISLIAMAALGVTAGCGGGSGSTTASTGGSTGSFSLNITDGPVDAAAKVVVEFTGVSIKPADGEAVEFLFDEAKQIDLLQLQGSASDSLLTNEVVTAGNYEWIRLHVNAEQDGVMDSYMEMLDGSVVELRIPSGAETGLKLVSGFTISAGGSADFTIDFDLRKSITQPNGMSSAFLRPALRIVDNMTVGSIVGTVAPDLVSEACADPTVDDGSVYVYAGADVTPSDIQGAESDPLVTALLKMSESGAYTYEVGFLPEGDYTLAYTCGASGDDPAMVDTIAFAATATVPVVQNLASSHDFVAEAAPIEDTENISAE